MRQKVIPTLGALPQTKRAFPSAALLGLLASAAGLVLFVEGSTTAYHSFSEHVAPDWHAAASACAAFLFFVHLTVFARALRLWNPAGRAARCFAWVGTPVLVVLYAGTLASTVASVLGTGTAYVVRALCGPVQAAATARVGEAREYLALAQSYVHRSTNATAQFLAEYERWSRAREHWEGAAFREVRRSPVVVRRIVRHLFAPKSVAEGQAILASLNATIADARGRLAEYEAYVAQGGRACTAYGAAAEGLSRATAGLLALGLAHYVLSAVHWRTIHRDGKT